ncbi:MAG: [FeFe] hydrogenase H-cluster radical SAM maturase HydG [Acidobacteria bacterium]|nr:MAG: [FeFe] hydrogenase H-cluster radical SAM maturase HydG [Acidobacteriota bacterium]
MRGSSTDSTVKKKRFKNHILSESYKPFIPEARIEELMATVNPSPQQVRDVLQKSMELQPLGIEETAVLVNVQDLALKEEIWQTAKELKKKVYGNRIVLFAPLYVGSYCVNDCTYCSFRVSNKGAFRKTLTHEELVSQVESLEDMGHKRLILVFGEHRTYDPGFIADTVQTVYGIKKGMGSIRRVNINAAPLDVKGFKRIHDAGIGTYQIFQETYHRPTYKLVHPEYTQKGDYDYRIDGLSRAFTAGCDDMGLGVLFGLYDWRFEVLALIAHSTHLHEHFGVGPHTLSFPRMQPAFGTAFNPNYLVSDEEFKHLVAVLRLAVPYAGMILTAREKPEIRREIMSYGVSQIDAGTRLEIGGYTSENKDQNVEQEQFELGDMRPMDEVMRELLQDGYLPSFCTSCYRQGRTGKQFMEFAIPGFIEKFCTPNGLLTLLEYLEDYASDKTKKVGLQCLERELAQLDDSSAIKAKVIKRMKQISDDGVRDLYF